MTIKAQTVTTKPDGIPDTVPNWIRGKEAPAVSGRTFEKLDPANGKPLARVVRSEAQDVNAAVLAAKEVQPEWAATGIVQRADVLRELALLLRRQRTWLARVVARECGRSVKDAAGEVDAAFELGMFMAGEGRRFYGRTTTSAMPHRAAMTVRQPMGVAGLIVAANTPLANVAWKAFPSILCGNGSVLKAAEDTPATALAFARLATEAGVPDGVFNVVQGYGEEAGAPLVEHPDVDLVSFTGSAEVGRWIQQAAGARLAKVCLELGGKNAFVVCDDANLDEAARWAVLSAFSNAGQRCASGSRLLAFEDVYEPFKEKLMARTKALRLGVGDDDDLGPVINQAQLEAMTAALEQAKKEGAKVLVGGKRVTGSEHEAGYYMAPTILEKVDPQAAVSRTELFGPITILYRVRDLEEALRMANDNPFGLTAAIHTSSLHRAQVFTNRIRTGVVSVNGPTYGSEPHMPFGGLGQSGTGWREPGTEALDVYSELKTVYTLYNPSG